MKKRTLKIQKKDTYLILIIFALIATNIISVFYFSEKNRATSFETFIKDYPFIDPARNFIDQNHFITNLQPLREKLSSYLSSQSDTEVGLYFEVLNTGANITVKEDQRFFPASLIKMPTALAVMKKIEDGEWKLSNELVLFDEDKNSGYGELYKKPVGTRFTIEELLKQLLIESDDTAHRILIRNLDSSNYEDVLSGLGMSKLFDNDYNITAKEYSRIFRSLYSSSFLKRDNSQILLSWLTKTPFNNFLGSGIPSEINFSHKIGEHDEEQTYLDSGIVYYPDRPYILTVLVKVKNGGQEKAEEIMKNISKEIYTYISEY